jgi:hypothetical protein
VGGVGAGVARLLRLLTALLLLNTALLVVALVGQGVAGARELPTAGPSGGQGLPTRPPLAPATPDRATFEYWWTTGRDLLASQGTAAPLAAWAGSTAGERDPPGPAGRPGHQPGHEDGQLPPPQLWQLQPRGALAVKDQPTEQEGEGAGFPPGTVLVAGPAAGPVPVAGAREAREELRARFQQDLDRLHEETARVAELKLKLERFTPTDPEHSRILESLRGKVGQRWEALQRAWARVPTLPAPLSDSIPTPPSDLAAEFQDHAAELHKRGQDLQQRFDDNARKLAEQHPGVAEERQQLREEQEELRLDIVNLQIENYYRTQESEGHAPQAPQPPGPPPVRLNTPGSWPLPVPQNGDLQHAQAQDGTLGTAHAPVVFAEDATTGHERAAHAAERGAAAVAAAEHAAAAEAAAAGRPGPAMEPEGRPEGANGGAVPHDEQQDGRGLPEPPQPVLHAKDATPEQSASEPTVSAQPPVPAAHPQAVVQQAPAPQPAPAVEVAAVDESGDPPGTGDAVLVADTWSDDGVFSNGWS